MSPGLRNVLDILSELAHNDTKTDVSESDIISQSGIPQSEVQIYLNELESRHLIEEVRPRLWRIKDQGLEQLKDQHLE